MEQENLNKDDPEAIITTRWILAVGLGGILVFVLVAYLAFGLINRGVSPTATSQSAQTSATKTNSPTLNLNTTALAFGDVTSANQSLTVLPSRTFRPVEGSFTAMSPAAFTETPSTVGAAVTAYNTVTTAAITPAVPEITPTPLDITILATATDIPLDTPTLDPATSPSTTAFTEIPSTLPATAFSYTAASSTTPPITTFETAMPTDAPAVALPKAAAQAFDQLQTLHFIIEIRAGKVEILTGTELKRAEGDLKRADEFQSKVLAHFLLGDLTVQTIGLPNEQYMTNPIGGKWIKLAPNQTFNLSVLFDQQNGIGGLTRQLQNVQVLGDQTINGVPCAHFTGTLPGSAVGPVTLGTLGHNPVTLEVWAGRDDNIIRQMYLKETVSNGAFWAINLSRFNQPVTIQKPAV